ncbi:hypothetical protein [Streptomyces sp. sk226]|uniref:hypothetical protein n=1 Tax=Streptomyces sp. sk226 TaxID=2034268 RepID=UPI000BF18276|nr:hypothetical protein [Streptomyces sp. sk226]
MRLIADHVERLTKARVTNMELGVPTTPDRVTVTFPNGFTGIVQWLDASTAGLREGVRPCYFLELNSLEYRPAKPKSAAAAMTQAGRHVSAGLVQGTNVKASVTQGSTQ